MAVSTLLVTLGVTVTWHAGAQAAALGSWAMSPALTPAQPWTAAAYGAGRWVIVGDGPEVAESTDGSNWSTAPAPLGSWRAVVYGDGRFVALASTDTGATEMTSPDGVTWTAVPGPTGSWTGLTFGEGRFVAVDSQGQIETSTTGTTWAVEFSHSKAQFTSVAYGGGRFVAVDGSLGATVVSPNATGWSYYPAPVAGARWGAVAYGNGTFVTLDKSGAGSVATSVLGYVWTAHSFSPAQAVDTAAFGCGRFVAAGASAPTANDLISSPTGATWDATAVPADTGADWTAVAYGAGQFVAVDSAGGIATMRPPGDCSATLPMSPQQVSGNVHDGEIWTYMHPPPTPEGARIDAYRVTVSDGSFTRTCSAPVYYEPNCIIRGLANRRVYSVTTQSHSRNGWSVPSDPEFAIPIPTWTLDAVTRSRIVSASSPVVVQVTGVLANALGIYPSSHVAVHFGAQVLSCRPNPFGECLITVAHPNPGPTSVYATYAGYGRSYRSPIWRVTVLAATPTPGP